MEKRRGEFGMSMGNCWREGKRFGRWYVHVGMIRIRDVNRVKLYARSGTKLYRRDRTRF